ncbi:hypothetical protein [Bradyrhizobium sp. LMTR 3]|uniref:hypothetical protein n=1 Tax=Bradyrhizobium sp. LMTR 3 TaxID=189873 RepID=UPI00114680B7|nr:hypothetical protein [Bradyrhizobium sp. LMTR 3]
MKPDRLRKYKAGSREKAAENADLWVVLAGFRRMDGAKRYPSMPVTAKAMGIASLHPSYKLLAAYFFIPE